MSERVTLVHQPDGSLAARKVALGPDEETRVRAEAVALRIARHPGVVTLLAEDREGLLLGWVGSRCLATHRVATIAEAGALLASVATTVADLHRIGITHGAIDASHVVLDSHGRPVLCSFALAEQAVSVLDSRHRERCAADVAGLGALLDTALREAAPAPPLRWGGRGARRSLERLADRAQDEAPDRRPSARAFAEAVADATSNADLAVEAEVGRNDRDPDVDARADDARRYHGVHRAGEPQEQRASRDRRGFVPRALAGTAVLVTVMAVAAVVADRPPDGTLIEERGAPGGARPTETTVPNVATDLRTSTTSSPTTASTASPPVSCTTEPLGSVGELQADVDGDGCAERIAIEGNVVAVAGHRWELGTAEGVVTIGDWDCDGLATPALLEVATGDVFIFPEWSEPGGSLEVARAATVREATGLRAGEGACPPLVVERNDGRHITLPASAMTVSRGWPDRKGGTP